MLISAVRRCPSIQTIKYGGLTDRRLERPGLTHRTRGGRPVDASSSIARASFFPVGAAELDDLLKDSPWLRGFY